MTLRAATTAAFVVLASMLPACKGGAPAALDQGNPSPPDGENRRIALTDLGTGAYLGFRGGLYPGGNEPPPDHAAAGRAALERIEPLDPEGRPSSSGRIVLVSVGMSNTSQEFCSQVGTPPCDPWTFVGQASADPAVDRENLVLVNGARGGQTSATWDSPTDPNYDRVRDADLARAGVTERQVQVAWVKEANAGPTVSLPNPQSDAVRLETALGAVVRAMKARWPNLQVVFFSSRIYGGHANTTLNPEPYAYETAFSVKWVIEAQIEQARTGRVDAEAGDLALARTPWLAWGPYLWADGTTPRSDGLVWVREDFVGDGTHPAQSGRQKVGRLLLEFLKSSPFSQCWFMAGRRCQR